MQNVEIRQLDLSSKYKANLIKGELTIPSELSIRVREAITTALSCQEDAGARGQSCFPSFAFIDHFESDFSLTLLICYA